MRPPLAPASHVDPVLRGWRRGATPETVEWGVQLPPDPRKSGRGQITKAAKSRA